MLSIVETITP